MPSPLPAWLRSRGSESEADALSPHEMRRKRSIKRMINTLGTGDASGKPLIFIDVFAARNLDLRKKNVDAYVAVHLDDEHEHITSIHKDANPEWHESCVFQVEPPQQPAASSSSMNTPGSNTPTSSPSPMLLGGAGVFADLSALGAASASAASVAAAAAAAQAQAQQNKEPALTITVFHRHQLVKDEAIGYISFKLDDLFDESVRHQWYPLLDRKTGAVIDPEMCVEVKVQYSASDTGKMNTLAEVLPLSFFEPLQKYFESLEPSQFCLLFDHAQAIPTSKEIRAILQIILATKLPQRDVFRYLCQREVESTAQEATLFRSNSLATKLVTAFCFYHGDLYLRRVLSESVIRIVHEDEDLEIDELKASQRRHSTEMTDAGGHQQPGEKVSIKNNIKKLGDYSKTVLENILLVDSSQALPAEIGVLLSMLCRQVAGKFRTQESVRIAVAGVLFLRFLCPALTSPQLYGLVTSQVGRNATRTMLLMTKIIQCCANNVEFGVKEPYMAPFNKLVKNCQKRMLKLFEQCSGIMFDASSGLPVLPAEAGAAPATADSSAPTGTADAQQQQAAETDGSSAPPGSLDKLAAAAAAAPVAAAAPGSSTPQVDATKATADAPAAAAAAAANQVEDFDEVELLWSYHTLHQYLHRNMAQLEAAASQASSTGQATDNAAGAASTQQKLPFQIALSKEDMLKASTTVRKLKALLDSIGAPTDAARKKRDAVAQGKD